MSDPFQPLGCERRFPSPGTRFIERYEFDRRRPPRPHATYFGGDERVTLRSVSVDAVDGAAISRARVLQDGYVSKDQTYIRVLVRGDDRLDPSELALVGETSFSLAIDKVESVDDTAPLARAIAAWMEEELGPNARVKLGDPAYTGIRTPYLQYPVSAKGHTELFATCHGLYSDVALEGKLVVRAADGAFVELSLAGTERLVEDYCSGIDSRRRYPLEIGKLYLRVTRDCFREPLVGESGFDRPNQFRTFQRTR